MDPDTDLRQVANEHWRRFYGGLIESLDGKWRRFGGVDAFTTPHVPASFANGVLVIEPATGADVIAATEWVRSTGAPFRVRIDTLLGAELIDAPLDAGLGREDWTMPGMVLTPIPVAPAPPAGVRAERVVAANFDDFIQATVDSGMPRPVAEQAFDLSATEGSGVDFFLGRLDGRPVATATLVQTDDVAGIYAVTTVENARRRGLGSAVTWAAVSRAREVGSRAVVLQSSQMGQRMYEDIGFRTVVEYAVFVPRGGAEGDL